MTISRTAAAAYLHGRFSRFADDVQCDKDAGPTGYGPDIDDALRDLSVPEASLSTAAVSDADRRAYFALAEYYAARRFWIQVSSNPNARSGDQQITFDKVIEALKAIMDDAAARAAALGYGPDTEVWGRVALLTDYIEPEPA